MVPRFLVCICARAALASRRTLRCLHTETSDGFFMLKDEHKDAHVYKTSTPTEKDAINVTGLVTGYNVVIMESIAKKGGWKVEFYQLNGFPEATHKGLQFAWPANLSSFDCDVNSELLVSAAMAELDFMVPTVSSGFIVAGPVPKVIEEALHTEFFTFLRPFTLPLWGGIFAFIAVCGFITYFLEGAPSEEGWCTYMYHAFGHCCGLGDNDPKRLPAKLNALFFGFAMMLIVSSYTANLASFLMTTKKEVQVVTGTSSLEELGLPVCVMDSHLDVLKAMFPRLLFVPIPKAQAMVRFMAGLLEPARSGKTCSGVISTEVHMKFALMHNRICDLQLVGHPFRGSYYSIPFLRKSNSSELVEQHNMIFLDMVQNGEVDVIMSRYFPTNPGASMYCPETTIDDDDGGRALGIRNFGGTFMVGVIGFLSSLVVALLTKGRIFRRKARRCRRTPELDETNDKETRSMPPEKHLESISQSLCSLEQQQAEFLSHFMDTSLRILEEAKVTMRTAAEEGLAV